MSEHELHRELEKSRIQSRRDLTELAGIQSRRGIAHSQTIGQVVRLGSEFESVAFPDLEHS